MHQHMTNAEGRSGWWGQLQGYQKFVFVVATAAWLFDCLDQQLFNLARQPAMEALVGADKAKEFGGYATSIFLIGWAIGGMVFGSLGDRFGRAKMLGITVLLYSLATGLSAASTSFTDFTIYRFITGLGVGGVFGLAVALVADTLAADVRSRALGVLQSFSAVGNIGGGLIGLGLAFAAVSPVSYWKWLFLIGALPAFLTAFIQMRLKEPAAWVESRKKADAMGIKAGSYKDLFGTKLWRKHALLGMALSCAGVVGLWGIGVFSSEMVGDVVTRQAISAGVVNHSGSSWLTKAYNESKGDMKKIEKMPEYSADPNVQSILAAAKKAKTMWPSINLTLFNVGAFFGMLAFTRYTVRSGRKKAFAVFLSGAMVVTIGVFQFMNSTVDVLWMAPLLGFFQLSVFAGFSIYLPELFPTRLRSTGVSFCYNMGRFAAASAPFTLGKLQGILGKSAPGLDGKIEVFRDCASWMSVCFLLGLAVLPFLPETKDQPLPQD
jgi:MFS family permease